MKNASKLLLNFSLRLAVVALLASCAANGNNGTMPSPAKGPTLSGTSDTGGGDWFVRPLPILKIQIPADGGIVEGVRYQRFDLPRCKGGDVPAEFREQATALLFPGPNFSAVKVQTTGYFIVCSFGVVESNPEKALQILVNNEDTNRERTVDGHMIDSKVYSGSPYGGNSLFKTTEADRVLPFSNHFLYPSPQKKKFFEQWPSAEKGTEAIYVVTGIEPSDRVYFGHSIYGTWRVVLPVPLLETEVPLAGYSEQLSIAKNKSDPAELDLLNKVSLPKGFPNGAVEPWSTVAQIFSTLQRTSTAGSRNAALIEKFNRKYSVELHAGFTMGYEDLKVLSDKFTFEFTPTIGLTEIQRPSFHSSVTKTKFTLPLLNPTWRVVADMIHEMTHAVQEHSSNDSQEQLFKNELEAHQNERAYLASLAEKYPVIKKAIATHRAIVAAGVPNVEFVDSASAVKPELALCENILKSYNLSRDRISPDVLIQAGCSK